jgi:predicted ATPase
VTAYYQNTAFTSDLVLALEKQLGSIYYVGPLRDYPSRLYLWSGEIPEHVGIKGEKAIEAILAGQDRTFNLRPGERKRTLPELVAGRLRAMGLIRDFQVSQLGKHRKEYEVLVKTGAHMPDVKLTDVGFGVSQVLPVVVECFYVPPHSVVIFEQPEIHLHPRVQAELADLFIDAIRSRENGQPRGCQFIIESHSEHFLRRLQRRIAEQEVSADDTALYFVHTESNHARLEALDVDMFGNIKNWPHGFFGDEMEDLVARTKAQANRMTSKGAEG